MAKARAIALDPDMPFHEAARVTVATRAEELIDHAAAVLDASDVAAVHDARVATRRLRAVLEIFATCFDTDRHREVLRDVTVLADALGERRDPDVQLLALEDFAAAMPEDDRPGIEHLADALRVAQGRGNAILSDALLHAEEIDLAGRLRALVASPSAATAGDDDDRDDDVPLDVDPDAPERVVLGDVR